MYTFLFFLRREESFAKEGDEERDPGGSIDRGGDKNPHQPVSPH